MQKEIKEKLFENIFNRKCFDCQETNPEWVSVNNAIFLCKECQVKHRSYGVSISYIRSLELDIWKDEQIAMLKLGGNERLKELMLTYNVKSNTDKYALYTSKLFDYYRKLLKSELRGDLRPKPPTDEESLEPIDVTKINPTFKNSNENLFNSQGGSSQTEENNINVHSEEDMNKNESENTLYSSVSGIVGSLWNKTKDTASVLKNKVDETGITEKVVSNTSYLYEKIKDNSSTILHKGSEVGSSILNKGIEYTHTGVEYTKNKVDEVVSN